MTNEATLRPSDNLRIQQREATVGTGGQQAGGMSVGYRDDSLMPLDRSETLAR